MKRLLTVLFCIGAVLASYGYLSGEEKRYPMLPPRFEQPKAGGTMDVTFRVALEGIPAETACVAVVREQATVLISRGILEHLKIAKPTEARTEEERMAVLHGRRAEKLLESATNTSDGFGCAIVQTSFDADAEYLVSELLKSGQAGVVDSSTNRQVDHIYVRFKSFRVAPLAGKGDVSFSLSERSAPFFIVLWWIS
jgi:hypothetical protein